MLGEHEGIDPSRKSVRRISIPQALRNSPTPPASASESSGSIPTRGSPAPVGCQRPRLARGARSAAELGGAIGNATSLVPSTCFRAQEETHGYFQLMRHVVQLMRHVVRRHLRSVEGYVVFVIGAVWASAAISTSSEISAYTDATAHLDREQAFRRPTGQLQAPQCGGDRRQPRAADSRTIDDLSRGPQRLGQHGF